MAQQPVNQPGGILGFIQDVAVNTSEVGNQIIRLGQDLNNDFINRAQSSEQSFQQTQQTIEQNLAAGKRNQLGEQLLNWLSSPQNLIVSVLALVGTLILVRKL